MVGRVRPSEPAATRGGTRHAARSPGSTSRRSRRTSPTTSTAGTPTWCASSPRPGRRRALDPPETSEGPHLAYAFQWFLFACLALGGYVVLARREAADRRAAASGPPTTVPVRIAG